MDLLMNGLLIAATLFAGGYCWVLARRVRDLKSLDSGLGGAIVTLTRQVELARTTLDEARAASRDTRQDLAQLVAKADGSAGQLRMLIAAAPAPPPRPRAPRRPSHSRVAAARRPQTRCRNPRPSSRSARRRRAEPRPAPRAPRGGAEAAGARADREPAAPPRRRPPPRRRRARTTSSRR